MTAYAGQAMTDIARVGERARVERVNARQHLRHRPQMAVVALRFGEREAVEPGRDVAMNQHALHEFAQRRDIARQRAEFVGVRSQSRHGAVVLIVFLWGLRF